VERPPSDSPGAKPEAGTARPDAPRPRVSEVRVGYTGGDRHAVERETPPRPPPRSGPPEAMRGPAHAHHDVTASLKEAAMHSRTLGEMADRALVELAREGDLTAFGELVRRHHPRVHRLAVHMLGNASDAEDVAQESFLRAFRALDRFDGRSEPYTWLYRITVNLCLNRLRSDRARRRVAVDYDARLEAMDTRADGREEMTANATRKEMYRALCSGVDALSESLRTTLILVCIDGLSHEAAGSVLGAPEGTIAWRVHEARRRLREHMIARGFDPDGGGP
jgi:RNA polymerase sigma-70 factor (ECF subfamily)